MQRAVLIHFSNVSACIVLWCWTSVCAPPTSDVAVIIAAFNGDNGVATVDFYDSGGARVPNVLPIHFPIHNLSYFDGNTARGNISASALVVSDLIFVVAQLPHAVIGRKWCCTYSARLSPLFLIFQIFATESVTLTPPFG